MAAQLIELNPTTLNSEWKNMTPLEIIQLSVNTGALIASAAVWKLYVGNLKAAVDAKSAEISSVEKNRDHWRDKANDLEKRSPEFMEEILAKRVKTREEEIVRLNADQGQHAERVTVLEEEKRLLEQRLQSTRYLRETLEIDDEYLQEMGEPEIVMLGEVGVDSGQLLVTDPCYIDSEWEYEPHPNEWRLRDTATGNELTVLWEREVLDSEYLNLGITISEAFDQGRLVALPDEHEGPFRYTYDGSCKATSGEGFGELVFKKGHTGAGVAFSTAFGDGIYPIFGEKRGGRIVRAYVNVA